MSASARSESPVSNPAAVAAAVEYVRAVGSLEAARAALDDIAAAELERPAPPEAAILVSEALRTVDTEAGRLRVLKEITSGPYPRYHAMPGVSNVLLRTESDGTQTLGKFVGREFRAIG